MCQNVDVSEHGVSEHGVSEHRCTQPGQHPEGNGGNRNKDLI
jgi:hypothetical protein